MFDKHVIKQADPSSIGQRFCSWQERLPKTEWTIEAAQELVWQACNQAGWPFINRSEIWDLSWTDQLTNSFAESVRFHYKFRGQESSNQQFWAACLTFDNRVIRPANLPLIDQRFGVWRGQVDYTQTVWDCEITLQCWRTRNIESAIRAFHFMFDKRVIKQADPSSIGQRSGSWQERLPKKRNQQLKLLKNWFDKRVIRPADPSLIDQRFGTWAGRINLQTGLLSLWDFITNFADKKHRISNLSSLLHVWKACYQAGWPFINRSETWDLSGASWLQTSCMRLWDFVTMLAHKKHRNSSFHVWQACNQAGWPFINRSEIWFLTGTVTENGINNWSCSRTGLTSSQSGRLTLH
jgi:hypothetical protein